MLQRSLQDNAKHTEQLTSTVSDLREQILNQTQRLSQTKEKTSQREIELQSQLEEAMKQNASSSLTNTELKKQLLQLQKDHDDFRQSLE